MIRPTLSAFVPRPRKIRGSIVIAALVLGLLVGGGVLAYSTYRNFDVTLQGLQTAHTAEQAAAKKLARKGEELAKSLEQAQGRVKALEQAQARVKVLEQGQKASESERHRLEARSAKLEAAIQGLQGAYATEQATARRSAQRAEELSKALEQAQAQVRALDAGQKVSEQGKKELEARSTKLENEIRGLQTAHAAEQALAKKLAARSDELVQAVVQLQTQLQARKKAREPAELAELNYALGTGYSKRGMNEEARQAFQTALKLDPNHADSHFEMARLYIGHFDKKQAAVPHLRKYLALKPTATNSEQVKGWLIRIEKRFDLDKERKGWGKMDANRGLERIFE